MTGGLSLGLGEVIGIITVFALFYHQIYSLNDSVEGASGFIGDIRDDLNKIDFKKVEDNVQKLSDIERDIEKVAYNTVDQPVEGGNSVSYELEGCNNKVIISLASERPDGDIVRSYGDTISERFNLETLLIEELGVSELSKDKVEQLSEDEDEIEFYEPENFPDEFGEDMEIPEEEDLEGAAEITINKDDLLEIEGMSVEMDINEDGDLTYQLRPNDLTVVHFDFENKINVQSVVGKMNMDEEVASLERELFTHEGYFSDRSPYEMIYVIASDDYGKIAQVIDVMVDKIEEYHQAFEEESKRFDEAVEAELFE